MATSPDMPGPPPAPPPWPNRRRMPHDCPPWVKNGDVFFITIACVPRHHNHLALLPVASEIEASLRHQHRKGHWWVHLFLLMPDHLHGLLSFSYPHSLGQSVINWKRYLSRRTGVRWQRDFFDHRIRNPRALNETWEYIRQNPVRKGLVASAEAWIFQWTYADLEPPGGDAAASEKPPYPRSR